MKWAFERLQRYQKRLCMFNDDMKGTAGVALAGLLGTVRAQGRPLTDFVNQKIVVVGAGSAGLGVFNMAAQAVSRMAGSEASPQFFLLDKDGLITTERKGTDPAAAPFAKAPGEIEGLGLREGANLIEVVCSCDRSKQRDGIGNMQTQLAPNGVMVVLTARDGKKGIEALEKLKENGLSDLVVFQQLDVLDPSTIASLADFIKTQFGRLDILTSTF